MSRWTETTFHIRVVFVHFVQRAHYNSKRQVKSVTLNSPCPAQPKENPFCCPIPLQEPGSQEAPPAPRLRVLILWSAVLIIWAVTVLCNGAQVVT